MKLSPSSSVITIPSGQTSGSVTLTVEADQRLEAEETATVSLADYSSGISAGAVTVATLQIADDSRPVISQPDRFRTGDDEFSWQTIDGAATYQVWLSRLSPDPSVIEIDNDIVTNGWQAMESLDAGMYRFWVRAVDSDQNAGVWSIGYTFEVRPSLIGPTGVTFDESPVFTWNAVPFAESYEIFVRDGSEIIRESGITDTFWQPTADLTGPAIRWWIRPDSSPGNRGWSEAGDLRIDGRSQVLAASPSVENDSEILLQWASVQTAVRYILHVERTDNNEVVIREDQLTDTGFGPQPLASGTYRAWVKAIDSSNRFSSGIWSRAFEFSVTAASNEVAGGTAVTAATSALRLAFVAGITDMRAEQNQTGDRSVDNTQAIPRNQPQSENRQYPVSVAHRKSQYLDGQSAISHPSDVGDGADQSAILFSGNDVTDALLGTTAG